MIRFLPAAAARWRTSKVAIIVVATPVTRVSGLPALNVSTVCSRQGTPTFFLIRSITCCAVREFSCVDAERFSSITDAKIIASLLAMDLFMAIISTPRRDYAWKTLDLLSSVGGLLQFFGGLYHWRRSMNSMRYERMKIAARGQGKAVSLP